MAIFVAPMFLVLEVDYVRPGTTRMENARALAQLVAEGLAGSNG